MILSYIVLRTEVLRREIMEETEDMKKLKSVGMKIPDYQYNGRQEE